MKYIVINSIYIYILYIYIYVSPSVAIPKVQYISEYHFRLCFGSASAIRHSHSSTFSNLPPWKRAAVVRCCVPCHLVTLLDTVRLWAMFISFLELFITFNKMKLGAGHE